MSPLEKVFSLTLDPQLSPSMDLLRVHVLSFTELADKLRWKYPLQPSM